MVRNNSAVLEEPVSVRKIYSVTRDSYAEKKAPRVSGEWLARQISVYLEAIDISPRDYKVPGGE